MTTQKQMKSETKRLKDKYNSLYNELEAILFRHDLEGIAFFDENGEPINPDEYAPEVGTILPRLNIAKNADDVAQIVMEEFEHWFDSGHSPENSEGFKPLAKEIWEAMHKDEIG